MSDILRNPKDPLRTTGPEAEQELLKAFGQVAHSFPRDTVIRAAFNLIVVAIRQDAAKQDRASTMFDEYMSRAKQVLLDQHYDNAGNRRNIFPYEQQINMPFFENKSKF